MTDDPKTGDPPTATDVNVAEVLARNLVLESQILQVTAERDEALKHLKQANDLIEADTKARLIEEAAKLSTMTLIELSGKDIAYLENLIDVSKMARKPTFESGADLGVAKPDKFDSRTYLHSKYVGNRKG